MTSPASRRPALPRGPILAALLALSLLLPGCPPASTTRDRPPLRGVVISCQTWGHEWASDEMVTALREVRALGANWVQIHPYLSIDRDGTVTARRLDAASPPPVWLSRPVAEAHALGLSIAIVPHVAGWRSGWRWRGDIAFGDDEAAWRRFFDGYTSALLNLIAATPDADGFAVGSELDGTIHREADWRAVIAAVRSATDKPITYAANFSHVDAVRFWDAVDVIGISAYYPVADRPGLPSASSIDRAWDRIHGSLADLRRRTGKPVVFIELGYDLSAAAAHQPWEPARTGSADELARAVQLRAYACALAALERHAAVDGAFLWKWFPGPSRGEDFLVSAPPVRDLVARRWARDTAPAPPPAP